MKQGVGLFLFVTFVSTACGTPQDELPVPQPPERTLSGSMSGASAVEGPFFTRYRGFAYSRGDRNPGECSTWFDIVYFKPAGKGPFPLYIYTVGTMTEYAPSYIQKHHLLEMAKRGVVAAAVEYDNYDIITSGCHHYNKKASCVFDMALAESAVSIMGQLSFVNVNRIVTSGHSQGGHIAILAGDWNPHIKGAHPTGALPTASGCLTSFALPKHRIRVGNGEHEDRHGCGILYLGCYTTGLACNRPPAEQLTGLSCGSSATTCLRPNGSGWFFVRDEDAPPCADHGYWKVSFSKYSGDGHPAWVSTPEPWGRDANLDWLAGMAKM